MLVDVGNLRQSVIRINETEHPLNYKYALEIFLRKLYDSTEPYPLPINHLLLFLNANILGKAVIYGVELNFELELTTFKSLIKDICKKCKYDKKKLTHVNIEAIPEILQKILYHKTTVLYDHFIKDHPDQTDMKDHFLLNYYNDFIKKFEMSDDIWPYVNVPPITAPELNTLGIVIQLHGSIRHSIPKPTTHTPSDVIIQKNNLSGYGSVCFITPFKDEEISILANQTLTQHQFTQCINHELYLEHVRRSPFNIYYDPLFHPTQPCGLIQTLQYYDKFFSPEKEQNINFLIFTRYYKYYTKEQEREYKILAIYVKLL